MSPITILYGDVLKYYGDSFDESTVSYNTEKYFDKPTKSPEFNFNLPVYLFIFYTMFYLCIRLLILCLCDY